MSKVYHSIILSTKSAGSSALQKFLVQNFGFNMTKKVRHHENETLFWTKAASILGLDQHRMHRSQVPYSNARAIKSLGQFCNENRIGDLEPDNVTKEDIFDVYHRLIMLNEPRFVEKSPHHLYNQSNLELIREFISRYQEEINFKVIGLVRHPLSVIYSGWDRWKFDCSQFEKEWLISNRNLLDYQKALGIAIVRYEDLVAENGAFMRDKLNLEPVSDKFQFRSSSLDKWKADEGFGHVLSDETMQLAKKFGYEDFDTPGDRLPWKLKSLSTYAGVEVKRLIRKV